MIFDDLPDDIKNLLPTEYASDPVFNDIPGVPTLFKNYKESKSYIGKLTSDQEHMLRVPSKEASAEDFTKFYENVVSKAPKLMIRPTDEAGYGDVFKSMGKPETTEGYSFPVVEGVTVDDGRKAMLAEAALKNDMTKNQFEGMAKILLESDKAMIDQQNSVVTQQDTALKDEWGQAYPDRMGKALAAFKSASGQDVERLNPEMAKVFFNVSEQIGIQSPEMLNQKGGQSGRRTPQEADIQMREALNNKDHIVNQPDSPERQRYLETEWTQLNADASGVA